MLVIITYAPNFRMLITDLQDILDNIFSYHEGIQPAHVASLIQHWLQASLYSYYVFAFLFLIFTVIIINVHMVL